MKYFLDTEFIEDGETIELLSIAVVAEDGREFYHVIDGVDWSRASDWVKENVLPFLEDQPKISKREMADELVNFVTNISVTDQRYLDKPEFWGYYADYDWVAICQLYGTMMDLPRTFPKYCRDLKQLLDEIGNPIFSKPEEEHNALADARWIKDVYQKIESGTHDRR